MAEPLFVTVLQDTAAQNVEALREAYEKCGEHEKTSDMVAVLSMMSFPPYSSSMVFSLISLFFAMFLYIFIPIMKQRSDAVWCAEQRSCSRASPATCLNSSNINRCGMRFCICSIKYGCCMFCSVAGMVVMTVMQSELRACDGQLVLSTAKKAIAQHDEVWLPFLTDMMRKY